MTSEPPTAGRVSPQRFFEALAARHRPRDAFTGTTASDVLAWQAHTLPAVVDTLGGAFSFSEPSVHTGEESTEGPIGLRSYHLGFAEGLDVEVLVARPRLEDRSGANGVVLCLPGHGLAGKSAAMGMHERPGAAEEMAQYHAAVGMELATAGFTTLSLDWLGTGAHSDRSGGADLETLRRGRDWCNLYYLHATILGTTPLAINLALVRAATAAVLDREELGTAKLGVTGFSGGSAIAAWLALTDDCLVAIDLEGYLGSFRGFAIRDLSYCGSQVTPRLFELVDLPDLLGLLVPRALRLSYGQTDRVFPPDEAEGAAKRIREIYGLVGASARLVVESSARGHRRSENGAAAFFGEHLRY